MRAILIASRNDARVRPCETQSKPKRSAGLTARRAVRISVIRLRFRFGYALRFRASTKVRLRFAPLRMTPNGVRRAITISYESMLLCSAQNDALVRPCETLHISSRHILSARSIQSGFAALTRLFFFSLFQPFNCFSLFIAVSG